jgi:hypothetical protein
MRHENDLHSFVTAQRNILVRQMQNSIHQMLGTSRHGTPFLAAAKLDDRPKPDFKEQPVQSTLLSSASRPLLSEILYGNKTVRAVQDHPACDSWSWGMPKPFEMPNLIDEPHRYGYLGVGAHL